MECEVQRARRQNSFGCGKGGVWCGRKRGIWGGGCRKQSLTREMGAVGGRKKETCGGWGVWGWRGPLIPFLEKRWSRCEWLSVDWAGWEQQKAGRPARRGVVFDGPAPRRGTAGGVVFVVLRIAVSLLAWVIGGTQRGGAGGSVLVGRVGRRKGGVQAAWASFLAGLRSRVAWGDELTVSLVARCEGAVPHVFVPFLPHAATRPLSLLRRHPEPALSLLG